ncbi:MAG: hypothetical protein IT531_11155 [Burkholderiales bacterium]|nr:hypothetical protein [Burkholderiales bacterium]
MNVWRNVGMSIAGALAWAALSASALAHPGGQAGSGCGPMTGAGSHGMMGGGGYGTMGAQGQCPATDAAGQGQGCPSALAPAGGPGRMGRGMGPMQGMRSPDAHRH